MFSKPQVEYYEAALYTKLTVLIFDTTLPGIQLFINKMAFHWHIEIYNNFYSSFESCLGNPWHTKFKANSSLVNYFSWSIFLNLVDHF